MIARVLATLLVLCLAACGGDVELPQARSLTNADAVLPQLYGAAGGPHEVAHQSYLLESAERDLPLSISFPDTPGSYPVVLFSHGNWSDQFQYDNLIHHWVRHGYVVIAPYHDDGGGMARGIFNALRYGNLGMITRRVDDVRLVLDRLGELGALLAPQSINLDAEHIAVAGHSFGAFTAQQFMGAAAWDVESESWVRISDDRIDAVVAVSPPGPMFDEITAESWLAMEGPVLMTTGTWDVNAQFWPEWQAHRLSFDTAVAGEQLALVVEGADHYLGNLICRLDREEAPQHHALAMVNAVSLAFLDAELKSQTAARDFLRGPQLEESTQAFARLLHR